MLFNYFVCLPYKANVIYIMFCVTCACVHSVGVVKHKGLLDPARVYDNHIEPFL